MNNFIVNAKRISEALTNHHRRIKGMSLNHLFALDPQRWQRFSTTMSLEPQQNANLLVDFSKQKVTAETMDLLFSLLRACGFEEKRENLYQGDKVNATEQRAAMHMALRAERADGSSSTLGEAIDIVAATHARMFVIADAVREGSWVGASGKSIEHVVNIGIGGSYWGPALVCEACALSSHVSDNIKVHFVSTVDTTQLVTVLERLDLERTLFIIASKSFGTQETQINAQLALSWMQSKLFPNKQGADLNKALSRHFIAVTANVAKAKDMLKIPEQNILPLWDWVGGRFSLMSAIGLVVAIYLGRRGFEALLSGAEAMDKHFMRAPYGENLPIILALIGIWNRNYRGNSTQLLLPYDVGLNLLPTYLQQLEMESNGKSVRLDGRAVEMQTAPVVWGGGGVDAQHTFMQCIHQGTIDAPADILISTKSVLNGPRAKNNSYSSLSAHPILLANALAQSRALMSGSGEVEINSDISADTNISPAHQFLPGDKSSTLLVYDELNATTLGALIALYEHKVFVQGVIWGINSFDQFGVELGKKIAAELEDVVAGQSSMAESEGALDNATFGLIKYIHSRQS